MESTEKRAVKIAAWIMEEAGLCRFESYDKCRRLYIDEKICTECIRRWLLNKARKELENGKDNV